MDQNLVSDLTRYSAKWGANLDLVQGAGGNTSTKDEGVLLVKASGMRLEDALRRNIFVEVPLAAATAMADGAPAPSTGGLRASIETSMHALMPHRFVAHFHSVDVLALAVRRDGEALLSDRLAGLAWGWIDYVKPGMAVAQAVRTVLATRPTDIIVLGSHGLVIGAETAQGLDTLLATVLQRTSVAPRRRNPNPAQLAELAARYGLDVAQSPAAHQSALDPTNLSIATAGSLYPDHVVFLGRGAKQLDQTPHVDDASLLYLAPGVGALLAPGLPEEAHEMAACLGAVSSRVAPGAPLRLLTAAEEDELQQWDAEKYRKELAERHAAPNAN